MKEYLDSNRVNFLIWRYVLLTRTYYRETAVKFQKEWHIQEPHRQLDFARHVKSHALVNVLNKGLLYHSLERAHAQAIQEPRDAASEAALAEAMQLGIFGPLLGQPSPPQHFEEIDGPAEAEADADMANAAATTGGSDVENTRKRHADRQQQPPLVNGSPAKRPRLSNGYENGVDAATTPMELDGDNHAYPSPLEREQALTPTPRTDGPEQGTQVEKVEELGAETTFIPLGPAPAGLDDEAAATSAAAAAAATASSPVSRLIRSGSSSSSRSNSSSDNAPVLLHCQWHPRDPTILAAAGTDALARIWNVSRGATTDPAADGHVNGVAPQVHSLVADGVPSKATVTAMAWNCDGSAIAVATDSETKARLALWTPEGAYMHHFEVAEPPIFKLRWNPNNDAILAIAPENGGALVTIYDATTPDSLTYFLPGHDLDSDPIDATWTSETEFLLCGGELFLALRCADGQISESQKFATRHGDNISRVQFDRWSTLAATCGEKGFVDIWDSSGKRREIEAHCDAVTALEWQPIQSPPSGGERLLASGGDDGAIFIWNVLASEGKAKCSMTMGPPIVALAFTPDGAFLAGATSERILIWKVGDHGIPRASWSRLPHPGWLSPRMNPEPDEEDEHCLAWDSTGHKLAYGVNSRLAIINFR
ncbi:WD40 repeat-like protein [Xylariaceae sp. FL0804]|nr:WD40 repeat-like protein [Xylariaceae sp. FL0804]